MQGSVRRYLNCLSITFFSSKLLENIHRHENKCNAIFLTPTLIPIRGNELKGPENVVNGKNNTTNKSLLGYLWILKLGFDSL